MSQAESFVNRFMEIWANPEPERYPELWTEDGVLLHPGMEEPLPVDQIADYVRALQQLVPNMRLTVDRWAARGDDVLIEWTVNATLQGEETSWKGVDRFTLRGDRAVECVAYFDTLPLRAKLDPSMERDSPVEHARAAS
jgi:uncharacterized protein (TIGR02246 family)